MPQSDAEKETFARLRGICKSSGEDQIYAELIALPRTQTPVGPKDTRLERFTHRLREGGASIEVVADRSAAVQSLSSYVTNRHRQRRVTAGHDPRLAALPWRDGALLPRFGCAHAGDAVAVSYASTGAAETGSLAVWLTRDNPATNNLLAEDHVVFLDETDLGESLEALWARKTAETLDKNDRPPRGMMIVSGPSSTADIGMELVHGAHGPRALHVIVIRSKP